MANVEKFGFDAKTLSLLAQEAGTMTRLAQIMMVSPKTLTAWKASGWCNYSEEIARNRIRNANDKGLFPRPEPIASTSPTSFGLETLLDLIWMVGGVQNMAKAAGVQRNRIYVWVRQGACPRDETAMRQHVEHWMELHNITPNMSPRGTATIISHPVSREEHNKRKQALREMLWALGSYQECAQALGVSRRLVEYYLYNNVDALVKFSVIYIQEKTAAHQPTTEGGKIYKEFAQIKSAPVTLAHVIDAYFKRYGVLITPGRARQSLKNAPVPINESPELAVSPGVISMLRQRAQTTQQKSAQCLGYKSYRSWAPFELGHVICWYPLWMIEKAARGERVA